MEPWSGAFVSLLFVSGICGVVFLFVMFLERCILRVMKKPYKLPQALKDKIAASHFDLKKAELKALVNAAWMSVLLGRGKFKDFYFGCDQAEYSKSSLKPLFSMVLQARREQLKTIMKDKRKTSLDLAFADLEKQGVIARQNFSCCQTCAPDDIRAERSEMESQNQKGYVYFHQQDTEALFETGSTYLGFGVFVDQHFKKNAWGKLSEKKKNAEYERLSLELLNQIVLPTLKRHKIKTTWSGEFSERVLVHNVDYLAWV